MPVEEWAAIGINALVMIAGLVVISVRVTWQAAQSKAEIIAHITTHAKEDGEEFIAVRNEIDVTARSFADSFSAIREKIREVELFGRDTYMRRESFYKTMEMLSADLKSNFLKVEARLDRMETKIDQARAQK